MFTYQHIKDETRAVKPIGGMNALQSRNCYIPIKNMVMNLISSEWAIQPRKNGPTTYSLRVMQIIANIAGLSTNTEIQENRNAKSPPNDSNMYEYSAPERRITQIGVSFISIYLISLSMCPIRRNTAHLK